MNPKRDATDLPLAIRLRDGDPSALEELCRRSHLAVRLMVSRQGRLRPEDAEDVLQIAAKQLWSSRERFDPARGTLENWFARIAANAAADFAKSGWCRARHAERSITPAILAASADHQPAATAPPPPAASIVAVRSALARLPAAQQRILEADMHSPSGKAPAKPLAKELGIAAGTVREYRRRALARLLAELEAAGHAPPETFPEK